MTVPHYHLPRMHRLLRERGVLERACLERGYWRVLKRAVSKPEGGGLPDDEEGGDLFQVNGL
jgi:fatty acid desaturase